MIFYLRRRRPRRVSKPSLRVRGAHPSEFVAKNSAEKKSRRLVGSSNPFAVLSCEMEDFPDDETRPTVLCAGRELGGYSTDLTRETDYGVGLDDDRVVSSGEESAETVPDYKVFTVKETRPTVISRGKAIEPDTAAVRELGSYSTDLTREMGYGVVNSGKDRVYTVGTVGFSGTEAFPVLTKKPTVATSSGFRPATSGSRGQPCSGGGVGGGGRGDGGGGGGGQQLPFPHPLPFPTCQACQQALAIRFCAVCFQGACAVWVQLCARCKDATSSGCRSSTGRYSYKPSGIFRGVSIFKPTEKFLFISRRSQSLIFYLTEIM